MKPLVAPFPYFGGKSSIAEIVWQRLGNVAHYIEPFFGSGAVLLARPGFDQTKHLETVNDKDGYVANVWRALQANPDEVARLCDWPVNHADLSARKCELLRQKDGLLARLTESPDYYDAKLAGYWVWAASCWIGSGMTSIGQIPHVSDSGKGVHRIGPIPHVSGSGAGVHRIGQIPHVSDSGKGVQEPYNTNIYDWFRELSERLRYVRVVCGDWTRVCGGNWQDRSGTVGIFMDPPYSHDCGRDNNIYCVEDDVAAAVREWCRERGTLQSYRIVLAGYDGEHNELEENGWSVYSWSAKGGYGNMAGDNSNRHRERLWFSPHCCGARQTRLL